MRTMQLATAISKRRYVDMIVLVIMLLVSLDHQALIESAAMEDIGKATEFLLNFGYLDSSKGATSITTESVAAAITEYQEFFGLNQTGVLDEETVQSMELPRCGNPDKIREGQNTATSFISSSPKRRKRDALEGRLKWRRTHLTYKVWNYPKLFRSRQRDVDEQLRRAFDSWTAVSPFVFVKTDGEADINIKWAVRTHCGGGAFDGPHGTLAHGFFPEVGMVHFDDEENWTLSGLGSRGKIDLYSVALHEFGHALGIEHKQDRRAIMFPTYGDTDKLHEIDISAIQRVYGAGKPDRPPPTEPPREKRPNLCKDASIDAITMTRANKVFVFKGDWYWILNSDADGVVNGFPRPIAKDWPGLPGSINAAVAFSDGKMYFFKNDKYWRYTNRRLDGGYPRSIKQSFPGIPDNVDGAFVWKNDKMYFFKNDQFWRFDWRANPKIDSNYPESISAWRGVPSAINDVFRWKNGITYFFKDGLYYKYNDDADEVESQGDPPFPRSASEWWFGCDNSLTHGTLDDSEASTEFQELEINLSDFQSSNSTEEESSSKELSLDSD